MNPADYTKLTTYQAGVMQASVHRALQKYSDSVLQPYGISKAQWLIIGTILDQGKSGIRISELAIKVGTTMSYLTNTINLLVSKKVLLRDVSDDDNRAKFITVDPVFQLKCEKIEQALRNELRKLVYSKISVDDFRTYMKVLHQLSDIDQLSL